MAKTKKQEALVHSLVNQVGHVGNDVASAHASAQPGSWADRYTYDFETNQVVAKATGDHVPNIMKHAKFVKGEDGTITAAFPELAVARMPVVFGGTQSDWDAEYFAVWDNFQNANDDKHDLRKSRYWYKKDPVVFKCTHMLMTMANSALSIECANEDFADIVDNWRQTAMPHSFMASWFLEYFRSGMVPVLKTLIQYVPREYKSGKIPALGPGDNVVHSHNPAQAAIEDKTQSLVQRNKLALEAYKKALTTLEQARAMAEQGLCGEDRITIYEDAVAKTQYEWQKGTLPGSYTILDPLLVDMDGPREMGLLRQPYLRISGDTRDTFMNPNANVKGVISTIPSEMVAAIRAGKEKVWLSPNICNVTFGDKQPYERYSTPLCVHAFDALEMKSDMMQMDRATSRSVKNRILLVKIGNDEYPEFDGEKAQKIQAMFATPSRNMTLVWNHCIELEWIEPNLESLKDQTKYDHWNAEIRTVFGISQVLTGTSETSGAIGNSIMNFKGLQEMVEEAQAKFLEFFQKEVKMLKAALGVSADVTAKFDQLNLKDEVAFWGVLNQAVMNGLLDQQTALELLRFNFPQIELRMEKMKKLKAKGLFVPSPSANNLGPDGAMLPQKGGIPTGGKPKKSPTANNNKNRAGKTSKKAKAHIQAVASDEVRIVVDIEALDLDHKNDIADQFNCPADWVLTTAEFKVKYPDIEVGPPWPGLATNEVVGCIRYATRMTMEIDTKAAAMAEKFKSQASGGARGPYMTESKKTQIDQTALTEVLNAHLPEAERPKAWAKYMTDTVSELKIEQPDMPDRDAFVSAFAMVAKRYRKSLAKP